MHLVTTLKLSLGWQMHTKRWGVSRFEEETVSQVVRFSSKYIVEFASIKHEQT